MNNPVFLHLHQTVRPGKVAVRLTDSVNNFTALNSGLGMDLSASLIGQWLNDVMLKINGMPARISALYQASGSNQRLLEAMGWVNQQEKFQGSGYGLSSVLSGLVQLGVVETTTVFNPPQLIKTRGLDVLGYIVMFKDANPL